MAGCVPAFQRVISKRKYITLAFISTLVILTLWTVISHFKIANPLFLPSPSGVISALFDLFNGCSSL